MNKNPNKAIEELIGDDITKDIFDIDIGEKKEKKENLLVPKNIKLDLDAQDLSIPEIESNLSPEEDEDLGRIFEDLDENFKKKDEFKNKEVFDEAKRTEEETKEEPKPSFKKDDGMKEVTARNVDVIKALEEDKKRDSLNIQKQKLEPTVMAGLFKLPAKIRSAMDMDEEDENENRYIPIFNPNDLDNQLYNYVNEQEKFTLQNKGLIESKSLQDAQKLDAVNKAEKDLKNIGLKIDKKELNQSMNEATHLNENKEKLIKKVVSKELKLDAKDVKTKKLPELTNGIKKIQKMGGNVEGMKAKDVVVAGNKTTKDKDVAKIIYDNAALKEQEKIAKKVTQNISGKDINKIVEKTGRKIDEPAKTKTKENEFNLDKYQDKDKVLDLDKEQKERIVKEELDKDRSNEKVEKELERTISYSRGRSR